MKETITEPLLELANGTPAGEEFQVPPLSMRSLLLLEKINSPFTAQPEPELNPVTGEPVMLPPQQSIDPVTGEPEFDQEGNPVMAPAEMKMRQRPATLTDIVQAFYVLTEQGDPMIMQIICDPERFENEIMHGFAPKLTPQTIQKIGAEINRRMMEMNDAVADSGATGREKKVTGPMPI